MTESIIQTRRMCYLCGRQYGLERHHILGGTANRKLSEKYGLWVWLCHDCHTGNDGAQYNKEKNRQLKAEAQAAFEIIYGHQRWMQTFGRNYIYESEEII